MNLEDVLAEINNLKDHRWASHDVIIKKIEEFEVRVRKAMSANVSIGKNNKIETKPAEEKERKRRSSHQNELVYTPNGGIDTPSKERE